MNRDDFEVGTADEVLDLDRDVADLNTDTGGATENLLNPPVEDYPASAPMIERSPDALEKIADDPIEVVLRDLGGYEYDTKTHKWNINKARKGLLNEVGVWELRPLLRQSVKRSTIFGKLTQNQISDRNHRFSDTVRIALVENGRRWGVPGIENGDISSINTIKTTLCLFYESVNSRSKDGYTYDGITKSFQQTYHDYRQESPRNQGVLGKVMSKF